MGRKRTVALIGPPGSWKTTSLETLPGGTVDFNTDPGGWRSLERPPISESEKQLILSGKKRGRIPKKLKFAKTFREWLGGGDVLQKDEILIIDYEPKKNVINVGLSSSFDQGIFMESSMDINALETPEAQNRGICHVAVDSLTGWQWAILEAIILFRGPTKSGYMGTDQDVYGKAIEKMREVIDVCCHLPFDFIMTAHVAVDKDDITGKIREEISIYGKKLPELIASMIDDIFYCEVDVSSGVPVGTWSAHPTGFLKALRARSFDNLPRQFEPNFSKLYKDGMSCD